MTVNKMKTSLIICTKNRPDDLKECLDSVFQQTELPTEIIIVDSSNSQDSYVMLKKYNFLDIPQVRFVYKHSDIQSSTYQRNRGIELSTGDILHFIDDDVILEPDYLEKINEIYRQDKEGNVGGVGGLIIQKKRLSGTNVLSDLFKTIFLLTNDKGSGKMLPSGWGTVQYRRNRDKIAKTEILQGCCSYRKKVLDEYKFDETLTGAAIREDLDISYRISRKYQLIYTPFAKLYHKASDIGREDKELYYQKYIYNHYYLFRKNLNHNLFNVICFLWSDLGSVLGIILISIKQKSMKPIKGALKGYKQIFQHLFHHDS